MPKRLFLFAAAAVLAACESTGGPAPIQDRRPVVERPPQPRDTTPAGTDDTVVQNDPVEVVDVPPATDPVVRPGDAPQLRPGITPAHLAGQPLNRLALLLPLSSGNDRLRLEAQSMLQAAQLALFDGSESTTVLVVEDTGGTASGAKAATERAISKGADVILGPVLANNVEAVAREARRKSIPVVAFSTDTDVAGRGTYLLSFPPEAEVERVVEYAAGTGVTEFAILRPDNDYGRRAARAYESAVARNGGRVVASETYGRGGVSAMQEPARRLAEFHQNGERASGGRGKQAFEAILLPEGGTDLRSVAPLLPFYSSTVSRVQYLGTALWMREDTAREPALRGGLFAGPDMDAREGFERSYERAWGVEPSRLASLAFDAVVIGATVANGDPRLRANRLEDPSGFYGADGFVSFSFDGQPRRGLAVYEVTGGNFRVVDPAPRGAVGSN